MNLLPLPLVAWIFLSPMAQAKTFRCDSVSSQESLQLTLQFSPNEKSGLLTLNYLGTEPATVLLRGNFRVQQSENNAILHSEIVGKFNYQVKLQMPKEYRAKNLLASKMKFSRSSTAPIYANLDCRLTK